MSDDKPKKLIPPSKDTRFHERSSLSKSGSETSKSGTGASKKNTGPIIRKNSGGTKPSKKK